MVMDPDGHMPKRDHLHWTDNGESVGTLRRALVAHNGESIGTSPRSLALNSIMNS